MHLNTTAGRTYNDITQYPVFPWIIRDYDSAILDFANHAKTFRDLSRPIGALNLERKRQFQERYDSFDADVAGVPKFHYGSHYSSAGIVLHFLLRLEPFTSQAIDLQGGRFDCPDRLFHSMKDCWSSCMNSCSGCKKFFSGSKDA